MLGFWDVLSLTPGNGPMSELLSTDWFLGSQGSLVYPSTEGLRGITTPKPNCCSPHHWFDPCHVHVGVQAPWRSHDQRIMWPVLPRNCNTVGRCAWLIQNGTTMENSSNWPLTGAELAWRTYTKNYSWFIWTSNLTGDSIFDPATPVLSQHLVFRSWVLWSHYCLLLATTFHKQRNSVQVHPHCLQSSILIFQFNLHRNPVR